MAPQASSGEARALVPDAPASAPGSVAATRVAEGPRWLALCVLCVAAALVFWVFEALPFQDLPAHAGLIALRHRFAASPYEQQFFVLAPHIGPYSLFRFLGEAFVRVVGPVGAVRALATLPVLTTPLALVFARRRLFGEVSPTYGFLGIALSFGLMTLLGFASYLLGVSVMLVGLVLFLELAAAVDRIGAPDAPSSRELAKRELAVALYAPLAFVAHGHAFLLLLLACGVSAVAAGRRARRVLRLRAFAPAVSLAAWVAWLERGSTTPAGSVPVVPSLTPDFHSPIEKFELLVTPTLMTRTGIDFAVALFLWALLALSVAATFRARGPAEPLDHPHAAHSRALLASAVTLAAAFLALPHSVGWFGFVDGRLVPVVMFLGFLSIRGDLLPRSLRTLLVWGAPVSAGAIVSLALIASYRFQDEARGYQEVLARVPAESRLLNLPLDADSDIFTAHPFVHYDKLVLADRPVVLSDVWFHQGSALYPTKENPAIRLPATYSESNLKVLDWPAYRLEEWDWVLLRTRPGAPAPAAPPSLELAEHRGGWWLFRRVPAPGG